MSARRNSITSASIAAYSLLSVKRRSRDREEIRIGCEGVTGDLIEHQELERRTHAAGSKDALRRGECDRRLNRCGGEPKRAVELEPTLQRCGVVRG